MQSVSIPQDQLLTEGDIPIIRSNGNAALVGRSMLCRELGQPTTFSGFCIRFRPDRERLDPLFAAYFLRSPATRQRFTAYGSGTGIQNLNQRIISELPIRLPPLGEQQRIAAVLCSLDNKIELNRRMNGVLEGLARAIFKSWFVDFEPVKAKAAGANSFIGMPQTVFDLLPKRFVNFEVGQVPEGWELVSLYDTAKYVNGAAFRSEHFCESAEGLPIIKIAELKNGITSQTKFSTRELDANRKVDTGDMLYSWSGSPETSLAVFRWTRGPGLLNQHIFKIICTTESHEHFVYFLLKHLRNTLIQIARNKQTTGLGHVTVADMKRLQVCRPPETVLDVTDETIGPLFNQSFANERETLVLATIRDTLLPKLISGELSVPDLDGDGNG